VSGKNEKNDKQQKQPKKQAGAKSKKSSKGGEKGGMPKLEGLSSFEKKYREECAPAMAKRFSYKSSMQIPRFSKIVVNTSMKEALVDIKVLETARDEMAMITGQEPLIKKAKKSIANFKLREGQPIGACVTLRGKVMYEFMNRLLNVALPRVRDFKGVSPKAFDGRGNYTLGITDQSIFPEIDFDRVQRANGMNITFVTTAKTDEEGRELLTLMGMPFWKN
jgi:large subunit ribosomal protein L5